MMYVGDFVLISSQNTAVTVQPTNTFLLFIWRSESCWMQMYVFDNIFAVCTYS